MEYFRYTPAKSLEVWLQWDKAYLQLVSCGQSTIFLQGVIAFSISAPYFLGRTLILKAITACKNIAVWPHETNVQCALKLTIVLKRGILDTTVS